MSLNLGFSREMAEESGYDKNRDGRRSLSISGVNHFQDLSLSKSLGESLLIALAVCARSERR